MAKENDILPVLAERLLKRQAKFPSKFSKNVPNSSKKQWTFNRTLKNIKAKSYSKRFFEPLIIDNIAIDEIYRGHCIDFIRLVLSTTVTEDEMQKHIVNALMLAELLETHYADYLDEPDEILRLQKHQKLYRELLDSDYTFDEMRSHNITPSESNKMRNVVATWNWVRLMGTRSRRAAIFIAVASHWHYLQDCVHWIEVNSAWLVVHQAWVWFMPRLLINVVITIKHLHGLWLFAMSKEEGSLDLKTRFWALMDRRWFELANDMAWGIGGFAMACMMTGPTIYLAVALQIFDVLVSISRTEIEIARLELDTDATLTKFLGLQDRIDFHGRARMLNLVRDVLLFIGVSALLPCFAWSPLTQALGAVLTVVATGGHRYLLDYLNCPRDEVVPTCEPANDEDIKFSAAVTRWKAVLTQPRADDASDVMPLHTFDNNINIIF